MVEPPKAHVDDLDDDLDDLDEVLDQFTPPLKEQATKPAVITSTQPSASTIATPVVPPAPPSTATTSSFTPRSGGDPIGEIPDEEDIAAQFAQEFASELAKGMESLMCEIGAPSVNTGGRKETGEKEYKQSDLRAAWEAMLIEEMGSGFGELSPGPQVNHIAEQGNAEDTESSKGKVGGKGDFRESIRQTMDRLKESEFTLQAGAAPEDLVNVDANFEQLLNEFGSGSHLGEGESEQELNGLLESMMSQLMSKEVLYEPLKELHEKFPPYLADNASALSAVDQSRYKLQLECVTKIIDIFEESTYTDQNTEATAKIVALMTDMQSFGSPPPEVLGPTGQPPDGCNVL